jgi:hypothetical protein
MISPGRPFWWADSNFNDSFHSVEKYYGIEIEISTFDIDTLDDDEMARKEISGWFYGYKADRKTELNGEKQFFERLQALLTAMNTRNNQAVQLLLKAVRSHFEADNILSQALQIQSRAEYQDGSLSEFIRSGGERRVADEIWQSLATSEERTRFLTEADSYEQQAMKLLD